MATNLQSIVYSFRKQNSLSSLQNLIICFYKHKILGKLHCYQLNIIEHYQKYGKKTELLSWKELQLPYRLEKKII